MRSFFLILLFGVFSCVSEDAPSDVLSPPGPVFGLRPIYANDEDLQIAMESARPINKAGKIYSYGDLLLVNEVGLGFHIYDNTNPRSPINKLFVSVPGSHDMAIKDGILYVDNYLDLLALEVTPDTIRLLKRLEGVMGAVTDFPPQSNRYFECVDPSKGIVVGWEEVELENPECYTP